MHTSSKIAYVTPVVQTDEVVQNILLQAPSIYRSSYIYKLDISMASIIPYPQPPLVTFNRARQYIKDIASISFNMSQINYLLGWQGTGCVP